MFILDTDHFSLMEWREGMARQNLLKRLVQVQPEKVFTSTITYEEQTRGWMAYTARARSTTQQVEAYAKLKRHLWIFTAALRYWNLTNVPEPNLTISELLEYRLALWI